ncbi:MAG TPA: phosphate ABC transporter ATP-binding protein [Acidimicrobiales bacterium]|nr:phosphate ABC transporter ATP-binding protein [Acidimicrobiales bacterium]
MLFEFDDVVVRFGEDVALDHVTAQVPDGGSVTCLLGASGSGKSTLLRLCNRLEVPTSGTVRFRGQPLDDLDPLQLRRTVGMVFQRPTPFPGTVRDNILVADPEATEDAMRAVLEQVHLPASFLDREADSLSGGEQQRGSLARTLITRPEVLLMDEPTSALDPTATKALEELGRELADGGMPVLWVTHDLDQADRIGDRRIVLVRGRVADEHQAQHYLDSEDAFHHHHGDETHEGHDDPTERDEGADRGAG